MKTKICIVCRYKNAYSEPFVHAHFKIFPADIDVLDYRAQEELHSDQERINYLQSNQVSLVIAEFGIHGVFMMEACRQTHIPLVVFFQGFDAYDKDVLDRFLPMYQRMFDIADALVCVSHDLTHRLEDLGAPSEKIIYNSSGVDSNVFQGADPESSGPNFVFVGRFVEKKAPYLTLLAFHSVLKQRPEAQLYMAGQGELLETCRIMAEALKLSHAVHFLGAVQHMDVAELFKKARAYVQHSIIDSCGNREGAPNSIKEAACSGLPIVSTYHAGIPELVIHNQSGFLVPEKDIELMAHYMVVLAQDGELAAKMGQRGRALMMEKFSMGKHIDALWKLISSFVGHNAST